MPSSCAPPVVLITGCSSGIGKHLALEFAAKGCTVLATARSVKSLDELTQNERIKALALDLDDPKSPETLRDAVVEITGGRLDVLVNNAGTHYAATALDLDIDKATHLFSVNVLAVMRMCQLFIPLLRRAPHGRIVQIGSVTRSVPVVWQCAYNASKAALSQYTRTLRLVSILMKSR
jgi:1-acylglycerone phosphate reductase